MYNSTVSARADERRDQRKIGVLRWCHEGLKYVRITKRGKITVTVLSLGCEPMRSAI